MRKTLFKAASVVFAACCVFASSCQGPEDIKPVFPENEVILTLQSGESTEIKFTANMDWTVKVSGDGAGNYFGILDAGIMETSVSGQAGDQTVTVGFTDDIEFDVDRVCTVTLEMGGESKEIAKLTKMRGNRVLSIYVAETDDFDFKKSEDAYVYGSEPVSSLELVTFPGSTVYSIPVKVVANYKWLLNTNSEYLTASVSEASSDSEATELLLTLTTDESLAAGATIELSFLSSASSDAASYPVSLTVPAFGNRMEIDCQSTLYFNKAGELKMPTGSFAQNPAICYLLAAKGAKVRALEWNAEQGWYDVSYAAWVGCELNFDENDSYLQSATALISVDANDGAERYADIMVLPASIANTSAKDLCTEDGSAIKEEYKQYLVGRLTQEGLKPDFVSLDPEVDNYKATLEKNAAGTDWMKDQFGTDEIYTLTYSDPYSESALVFLQAVNAEIYDYDCNRVSESALSSFWLEFTSFAMNKKGRVYMYPDAYVASSGENPESFILLKDASGNALALIDCVYNEAGGSESGEMFSISQGNGTVTRLTSGDYYEGICGNYSVSEVYDITVSSAATIIKSATAPSAFNIYNMELSLIKDGSLMIEGHTSNEFYVYVGENVSEKTSWIVVGKDYNGVNYAAFIFTYDPNASGSKSISFAYPEYVKNAEITKYSGSLLGNIKNEHYGVDENVIYELKYTGEPQMALLNVPGEPYGQVAWNNFDESTYNPYPNYWLTYEMEGSTQMYVNMAETGKSDWFVWMDMNTYKPILILVCTAVAAN